MKKYMCSYKNCSGKLEFILWAKKQNLPLALSWKIEPSLPKFFWIEPRQKFPATEISGYFRLKSILEEG